MASIQELYKIFQRFPIVSKDTREDVNGTIYFALKGANFDGNKFAQKAIQQGAVYAIVDDISVIPDHNSTQFIHVENVLDSLQNLARYHREQMGFRVLGITGSNGKTTTKELIAKVLKTHLKIFATKGNYNNHIGIPLTLLSIMKPKDLVILEMGASAQGEIESYCQIAKPDFGVVTNIGTAHWEGFGGQEGIIKGKGELYDFLANNNGHAFVNTDEPFLEKMSSKVNSRTFYSESNWLSKDIYNYTVECLETDPSIRCNFLSADDRKVNIQSNLMGQHNFRNICTALAIGNYFNVPAQQMKRAIENYRPSNNRSQIIQRNGVEVILDAYNANPDSMKKMLTSFFIRNDRKKIAVLGEMKELGDKSVFFHQEIVDFIAGNKALEKIYLVGKAFESTVCPPNFYKFKNIDELKKNFRLDAHSNYSILLKGSRSNLLEKLI